MMFDGPESYREFEEKRGEEFLRIDIDECELKSNEKMLSELSRSNRWLETIRFVAWLTSKNTAALNCQLTNLRSDTTGTFF